MPEYSVLGKRTPRGEALPKVTGEARFAVDLTLPGMLHGKMLTSPYSHARIVHIDTSRASRLPGVKAILTPRELPDRIINAALGPPMLGDRHFLPRDKVRYRGEAVAAVAAVDEDIAEEALYLIDVEYEPLPVLLTSEEALAPGAVLIHDASEGNIPVTSYFEYGDVEQGFRESDYVREDTFEFNALAYAHPEPQNSIASWDPISGRLTVWVATQSPNAQRDQLSNLLEIPWTKIRIITPFVGGGYGGRGATTSPVHLCAAALAKKAGRPVKNVQNREQEFALTWSSRHHTIVKLKTGVKRDGTLMAREATAIYDCGAYRMAVKGPTPQSYVAGLHMPYKIPNFKGKGISVYTNKQPVGPFRGYGQYPPAWAAELQMDVIARELGLDPLEMRIANAVVPHSATALDWQIGTCGLTQCMEEATKAVDWEGRRRGLPAGRGRGMSTSWFATEPAGGTPQFPLLAEVRVDTDGTATLIINGSDSGSGQYSTLCMMVAEDLGIPLSQVNRQVGDTDLFATEQSPLSVTIASFGKSVRKAALHARQIILEEMASKLEAAVEDLVCADGRVHVTGSPDRGMSFAEAARMAIARRGAIVGRGESVQAGFERWGAKGMAERFVKQSFPATTTGFSFGAAAAEVDVDKETGQVTIQRVSHAYDVGFAVNPMEVEAQLEGGAGISIGGIVSEEIVQDEGRILNSSYLDYKLLTAMDIPRLTPIIVEENDLRDGPFGAKELGMGSMCAAGCAVASAIYDATGVMVKEFPITPERILRALATHKQDVANEEVEG